MRIGSLALATLVTVLLAPMSTGCYADDPPPPPDYADGYAPMYYDGYVVYYDDGGRPFYYVNGAVAWIPPTSPFYVGYVDHWRTYGPAYHRWYAHYGQRYTGYSRGRGYYGHRR
jgi:hypothetical protein